MAGDAVLSSGEVVDDQGRPINVTFRGSVSIGGVTLTGTPIVGNAPKILSFDAAVHTFHDVFIRPAYLSQTNGTLISANTTDTGTPRVSLADAATQRIKWVEFVPPGWEQVSINFTWAKEAAGSGNVKWQLAYRVIYLFVNDDINAGAVTTLDLGAIAVPSGTQTLTYQIPPESQAIATPAGAFGISPLIMASLSRLGSDGTDTYTGAVSVISTSLSRTE